MRGMRAFLLLVAFSVTNVSAQEWIRTPPKYAGAPIVDASWVADHGKGSLDAAEPGQKFAFVGRVDRIASSNDGSSGPTSSYISWLARISTVTDQSGSRGSDVSLIVIFRDMPVIAAGDLVVIFCESMGRKAGTTAPWPDTTNALLFHGEYYVCHSGFRNFGWR